MGQRAIRLPGRHAARDWIIRSEEKLQRELHQPGITGLGNLAELRAVGSVAVWIKELRVIEDVKELSAKINTLLLANFKCLQDSEIRVADMWSAADRTLGIAHGSQQRRVIATKNRTGAAGWLRRIGRVLCEAVRIEEIEPIRLWLHLAEWSELSRLAGQFKSKAGHQFVIGEGGGPDGESCLESRGARKGPGI